MKKIAVFLLIILPLVLCAAENEIDKGSISIGGLGVFASFGGDLYKDAEDNGITYFSLEPDFQYFVAPGFGIGASLVYGSWSQGDMKQSEFGIGPALQYFFNTGSSSIYPALGAAFFYTSDSYDDGQNDSKISGTKIRFMGGALFILAEHFGLEGGVFYDIDSQKGDWDGAESTSGSIFGVRLGFKGFIY